MLQCFSGRVANENPASLSLVGVGLVLLDMGSGMGPPVPGYIFLRTTCLKPGWSGRNRAEMTVPMPIIEDIRRLDREGMSGRQIACRLGVSRDSVAKYLAVEDFSPPVPARPRRNARLVMTEQVCAFIAGILEEDRGTPRKQRHTAKRIYERLVEEQGFTGSYRSVSGEVARWKLEHGSPKRSFKELKWSAGSAQVDFGAVDVDMGEEGPTRLWMLAVSFPHSNARYAQMYRGQTAECVVDGLQRVFTHVGFIPHTQVFDNGAGVGHKHAGQVVESELFARFRAHARFEAIFCNPYSGNEKGSVENAVGYLRRNLMVPTPTITNLDTFNKDLLARCDKLLDQEHYRKKQVLRDLFTQDKTAGLPLPAKAFVPVRYTTRKADREGRVKFEDNYYLAHPGLAGGEVTLGVGHDTIAFFNRQGTHMGELPRSFTHQQDTVSSPQTLLDLLATRAGAWKQTPLREHMPANLVTALDEVGYSERRRTLRVLQATSHTLGFEETMAAALQLTQNGSPLTQGPLELLAARIGITHHDDPAVDLNIYDQLLTAKNTPA